MKFTAIFALIATVSAVKLNQKTKTRDPMLDKAIDETFKHVDTDKDGEIDEKEFTAAAREQLKAECH